MYICNYTAEIVWIWGVYDILVEYERFKAPSTWYDIYIVYDLFKNITFIFYYYNSKIEIID